ncbi:hypothetical protein ACLOJK_029119 [Asimina triloba]
MRPLFGHKFWAENLVELAGKLAELVGKLAGKMVELVGKLAELAGKMVELVGKMVELVGTLAEIWIWVSIHKSLIEKIRMEALVVVAGNWIPNWSGKRDFNLVSGNSADLRIHSGDDWRRFL